MVAAAAATAATRLNIGADLKAITAGWHGFSDTQIEDPQTCEAHCMLHKICVLADRLLDACGDHSLEDQP
jgi:hypothetical protein